MKLIKRAIHIFDRTNEVLFASAGIIIISMMFLVLMDVVLRLLKSPILGTLEIIEYGLIYFTFLGAAYLLKTGGHIRMDLVLNYAKPRTQALINAITSGMSATIWLVLTWYSSQSVWDAYQFGFIIPGILNTPVIYILSIIPLGSFLLFIQSLRMTYGHIKSFKAPKITPVPSEKGIEMG